jgi:hypothetical protein
MELWRGVAFDLLWPEPDLPGIWHGHSFNFRLHWM